MDGINIPAEVAEEARVPEDLDSSVAGPYRFPSPERRKTAAIIYLGLALVSALVIPNRGIGLFVAGLGLVVAWWHWRAGWPLRLQAEEALAAAAPAAPFPVGHASAAVIFAGWTSRPRWHVVMYDSSEPPGARALVVVDGVSGELVGEPYTEMFPSEIGPPEIAP